MKSALRRGNVNAQEADGSTALLWATYHVNADAVRALLAAGADPNIANHYGMTPLLEAAKTADDPAFEALLAAGARVSTDGPGGETPLMAAAYAGSAPEVKALIARGVDVNAREHQEQQTALMWAAEQGHLDVVKALLAAGARVDLAADTTHLTLPKDMGDHGTLVVDYPRGGLTALMFAAREGHLDVVRALISAGARPTLQTPEDHLTAMLLAVINDNLDVAQLLLDHGADPNDGSLNETVNLYNEGVSSVAQDATRPMPWHDNSIGPMQFISQLLDHGADPKRVLDYALHESGAGTGGAGTANEVHECAYFTALQRQDGDIVRLFLSRKLVDPDVIPGSKSTPLLTDLGGGPFRPRRAGEPMPGDYRIPGARGPDPVAAVLVQFGADVNASDARGQRAIHVAAENGDLTAITLLAAHGAMHGVKTKAGLTPIELAMGKRPPAVHDERLQFIPRPPVPHPQAAALLRSLMAAHSSADLASAEHPSAEAQ